MPFNADTKAKMFIKSARICCLCYKPCGTNIEAAHIIDEHKGGSNEEDNGIPLCFDCHQEIGSYDPKHPKGNKFSEEELKARRDSVYDLVKSGFLQAQIVLQKLKQTNTSYREISIERIEKPKYKPSSEALSILDDIIAGKSSLESIPYKIDLLNEEEQAYILESLVNKYDKKDILVALLSIISNKKFADRGFLMTEQLIRKVTISSDLNLKNAFASGVGIDMLQKTNEGLRTAFFVEFIDILERNQFNEINLIANAVVKVQDTIPEELRERYILALLKTANGSAYTGKPAARYGLNKLAPEAKSVALGLITPEFLQWQYRKEFYKEFVEQNRANWPKENKKVLEDFVKLDEDDFSHKYRKRRGED